MLTTSQDAIEATGPDGLTLRIQFQWQEDRYGHTVSLRDAIGTITPLLQSIEGQSEDDWPSSPPLQTLSIEKMPDGRAVGLLIGMAGRGHWSASVEPLPDQATVCFDFACRYGLDPKLPCPPQRLCNRYRSVSPLAKTSLSIESDDAIVSDVSGVIEMAPKDVAAATTTRWRYTIRAQTWKLGT